jgi:hypothetical protein
MSDKEVLNMEFEKYEYEAVELFMDNLSKDELIKFIIGQSRAIEGLTENNRSFGKAYRNILSKEEVG